MKKLLVGYDGSRTAQEAVAMAGRLAEQLGATVTVMTVEHMVTGLGTGVVPTVDESAFLPLAEEGAKMVRDLGVDANALAALGDPAQTLNDVAVREGYDLVVVGHGRSGIKEFILGSTAKKLAMIGTVPLLVVRSAIPDSPRKILAAVDGSEHALSALRAAAVLAKAFDAKITLLHVVDTSGLSKTRGADAVDLLRQTLQMAGQQALAVASQVCQQLGVRFEVAQIEGRPAQAICATAHEGGYDTVAVGRRGISGLAGLFLGSASDEVLKRPVPLVLLASG